MGYVAAVDMSVVDTLGIEEVLDGLYLSPRLPDLTLHHVFVVEVVAEPDHIGTHPPYGGAEQKEQ